MISRLLCAAKSPQEIGKPGGEGKDTERVGKEGEGSAVANLICISIPPSSPLSPHKKRGREKGRPFSTLALPTPPPG